MFRGKSLISLCLLAGATGCVQQPVHPHTDDVGRDLARAANRVDSAWQQSNAVTKAATPSAAATSPAMPADLQGPLTAKISLTWFGPIAPAVSAMSHYAGYQFVEHGVPAGPPILISIDSQSIALYEAFRSAGIQAGDRADVSVDADAGIVELSYRAPELPPSHLHLK